MSQILQGISMLTLIGFLGYMAWKAEKTGREFEVLNLEVGKGKKILLKVNY